MMTPRSRCPIVINSSSSLSSVAIQEENFNATEMMGENKVFDCTFTDALSEDCSDDDTLGMNQEEPLSRISSNLNCQSQTDSESSDAFQDLKAKQNEEKTQNLASSTNESCATSGRHSSDSSIFSGFFKHLSTSSLIKLVARLSNNTSPSSERSNSPPLNCYSPCNGKEELSHDDSLSTVFKDYLFSRNILTDNPVDLSNSTLFLDLDDSGKEETNVEDVNILEQVCQEDEKDIFETDKKLSDQKDTRSFVDSANRSDTYNPSKELENTIPKLSHSLLYCLDGNNPLYYEKKSSVKRRSNLQKNFESSHFSNKRTKLSVEKLDTGDERITLAVRTSPNKEESKGACQPLEAQKRHLHSCSPASRSMSLLQTKNGTPLPSREKGAKDDCLEGNSKNVLFETDL